MCILALRTVVALVLPVSGLVPPYNLKFLPALYSCVRRQRRVTEARDSITAEARPSETDVRHTGKVHFLRRPTG